MFHYCVQIVLKIFKNIPRDFILFVPGNWKYLREMSTFNLQLLQGFLIGLLHEKYWYMTCNKVRQYHVT